MEGLRLTPFKEDWSEAKERFKAWWDGEVIDRPVIQAFAPIKGLISAGAWDGWSFMRYPEDLTIGIRGFERVCEETFYGGEAFPNLHINLGPGVMAAYVGAVPRFISETVWFETPKSWTELRSLEYDLDNRWWRLTQRVASMALKVSKGRFIVGTTDLGGILDVAASLRGSNNLIIDLFKHPGEVKDLCGQLVDLWHRYYEGLHSIIAARMEGSSAWMGLWSPKRWYPIQCDFSAMMSPKQFQEFALPYLREQCQRLDHTVYHWDGPGQIPHLNHLLSIPELNGIQWTPGAGQPGVDSLAWFPLYRKIQEKGKLLVLLGADRRSVRFLLKELPHKGLLIRTSCITEEEARSILEDAEKI